MRLPSVAANIVELLLIPNAGNVVDGEKRIWCNALLDHDAFPSWMHVPVDVADRGSHFGQIEHVLLEDECVNFHAWRGTNPQDQPPQCTRTSFHTLSLVNEACGRPENVIQSP